MPPVIPSNAGGGTGFWIACIMMALIIAALYWYLKKNNPDELAKLKGSAGAEATKIAADFQAVADKFHTHVADANANVAASNANVAAAIAKIPALPPLRYTTPAAPTPDVVSDKLAAQPSPSANVGATPLPTAVVAPVAPLPTPPVLPVVRDPFTTLVDGVPLGVAVVAWGLDHQDDATMQVVEGALPKEDRNIAVCDDITNYVCANPSFALTPEGFMAAYSKVKKAPVAQNVNPPLPLTDAVAAKLITYTTKCLRECDRIGYLKLAGNSDLFNYMTTNGLFTASWFYTADYATTSGTYDPTSKTQVTLPRVWE